MITCYGLPVNIIEDTFDPVIHPCQEPVLCSTGFYQFSKLEIHFNFFLLFPSQFTKAPRFGRFPDRQTEEEGLSLLPPAPLLDEQILHSE